MTEPDLTPLMRQYQDIKQQYDDAIVFFRVGDFYEMFFKDAEEASRILEIVLTSRGKAKGSSIPLCGVPYHAATGYIAKLLKAGRTVALCEQVEDPKLAKGLVRREVVRLYTPGTLFDAELLPQKESNFLASLYCTSLHSSVPDSQECRFGLSTLDLSTGEFWVTESTSHTTYADLLDELTRIEPKELIFPQELPAGFRDSLGSLNIPRLTSQDPSWFDEGMGAQILKDHYSALSMEDLGLSHVTTGVQAAGALLQYLKSTQPIADHQHIQRPRFRSLEEEMHLDGVTIRNLELIKPLFEDRHSPTLLSILDKTVTSFGGRLFRQWITRPLLRLPIIQERLQAVDEFVNNLGVRSGLRTAFKSIQDLERLNSRISLGVANPRELVGLQQSLEVLPNIRLLLEPMKSSLIRDFLSYWDDLQDVYHLIDERILTNAPLSSREGDIIEEGYNKELDELRKVTREGTQWIAELEVRERNRTGIESLKIKFNQVFGYYIEVTKANLSKVPNEYLRKQTLVNAERYMTEELRQLEDRITGASQKVKNLELSLFSELRLQVAQATPRIQSMAQHLAVLDVLASLAEAATVNRYVRPHVDEGGIISIGEGRHPIIERLSPSGGFVPNNTHLNLETDRLLLITGPNMAGKSTYLRQAALIVLMAQIGSFVPAQSAHIGLVDRIFTRVGASDDLASGQSTFMVEMVETARILEFATRRSLILLDEVGRGTSTYDGLSIAWAVAEYLLDRCHIGARTLFATHYHEMTQLEDLREGVKNFTVLVKEKDQHILFLRKIIEGKADRSYGIHVAQLAGLPSEVIERAQNILRQLEGGETTTEMNDLKNSEKPQEVVSTTSLPQPHVILEEVKQMDLFGMTPLEALNRLADMKRRLETEDT
ncbi:MAG: DNA mismatch repair protein MutS [Nitrospirota bacterium]|nr:MAG: DNA mismatch repair protein MutS [Nitrospirota bacterium]